MSKKPNGMRLNEHQSCESSRAVNLKAKRKKLQYLRQMTIHYMLNY